MCFWRWISVGCPWPSARHLPSCSLSPHLNRAEGENRMKNLLGQDKPSPPEFLALLPLIPHCQVVACPFLNLFMQRCCWPSWGAGLCPVVQLPEPASPRRGCTAPPAYTSEIPHRRSFCEHSLLKDVEKLLILKKLGEGEEPRKSTRDVSKASSWRRCWEKEILLVWWVLQEGHVPPLEINQPKGLTSKNRQEQRKTQFLLDVDGIKVWLLMAVI